MIILVIRWVGVGYGSPYMVRPQTEPCAGIPRLDIFRIRQPNSPNDESIILKEVSWMQGYSMSDLRKRVCQQLTLGPFSDVLFPAWNFLFPVEISILANPKQISVVSNSENSEKQKKKKKKKGGSSAILNPHLLCHGGGGAFGPLACAHFSFFFFFLVGPWFLGEGPQNRAPLNPPLRLLINMWTSRLHTSNAHSGHLVLFFSLFKTDFESFKCPFHIQVLHHRVSN